MTTKLLTLTVVALTLAACGTAEPETAVAFYPVEATLQSDFQATAVAGTLDVVCSDRGDPTLQCFTSDKTRYVGLLTPADPVLMDEPTPIATPREIPEDLEGKFIEIACRLCARYQGQAGDACTVCESDDEPELLRPQS